MRGEVKTGKWWIKQSERKKKTRGIGPDLQKSSHRHSYVDHMDGFNPVTVRLMSRVLACPQQAQTFLVSARDNCHHFVLKMDDKAKRTPTAPPPSSTAIKNMNIVIGFSYSPCTWRKFVTHLFVVRPQALLQLAGCAAGTAAVPSTKTRASG